MGDALVWLTDDLDPNCLDVLGCRSALLFCFCAANALHGSGCAGTCSPAGARPDRSCGSDRAGSGITGGTESHAAPLPTGPTVIFDTSMGRMTCKLFDKEAPEAVANFVGLATGTKEWTDPTTHQKVTGKPFYDGTTFHRVIPEFMIQGGDRLGTGEGDPGYTFKDEFDPNLNFDVPGGWPWPTPARTPTASQFFITEAPQPHSRSALHDLRAVR